MANTTYQKAECTNPGPKPGPNPGPNADPNPNPNAEVKSIPDRTVASTRIYRQAEAGE